MDLATEEASQTAQDPTRAGQPAPLTLSSVLAIQVSHTTDNQGLRGCFDGIWATLTETVKTLMKCVVANFESSVDAAAEEVAHTAQDSASVA